MKVVFEQRDRNGLHIEVMGDGLSLGVMRRAYDWSGWFWHPYGRPMKESVMLGRDTYRAKVKLRKMLS